MTSPTPDSIRAARDAVALTQSQCAQLVHAGLRTWQQWEAGDRKMHPAFWELLKIKLQDVNSCSGMVTGGILNLQIKASLNSSIDEGLSTDIFFQLNEKFIRFFIF